MEACIQELGWGGPSWCLCSPLCWEGAVVPCQSWKSALLAWHSKDVPNLLSQGPPHLARQAVECKPSRDLKKVDALSKSLVVHEGIDLQSQEF